MPERLNSIGKVSRLLAVVLSDPRYGQSFRCLLNFVFWYLFSPFFMVGFLPFFACWLIAVMSLDLKYPWGHLSKLSRLTSFLLKKSSILMKLCGCSNLGLNSIINTLMATNLLSFEPKPWSPVACGPKLN